MKIRNESKDPPAIEGYDFCLRRFSVDDARELYLYSAKERIVRCAGWTGPKSEEEAAVILSLWEKWYRDGKSERFAVIDNRSGNLAGMVELNFMFYMRAETGYELAKDYRGKGLMTAAVRAVSRYGLERLKLRALTATVSAKNEASQRVLERAGYIKNKRPKNSQNIQYIYKKPAKRRGNTGI